MIQNERYRRYELELRLWERCKSAWWRIFARKKWKANKPKYVRR